MFEFVDYLFSGPPKRVSGVLYTFRSRASAGRKELQQIADRTHTKVVVSNKTMTGEGVAIEWSATGLAEDIENFKRLLSTSKAFDNVAVRTAHSKN